jgi:hypothetical protein
MNYVIFTIFPFFTGLTALAVVPFKFAFVIFVLVEFEFEIIFVLEFVGRIA